MDSKDKKFSIDEAVKIITDEASKKFVEAIDVAVNLGIDPVKTDQAVRGATNLPHGNGKTYKVAVFAEGDEAKEAITNQTSKNKYKNENSPGLWP